MNVIHACQNLWVGCNEVARSMEWRDGHEIQAILSVLSDRCVVDDNHITRLRLSPPDGPGFEKWHIDMAVRFLERMHQERGLPTLVHCWGGSSRSVAMATTYLYLNQGAAIEPIVPFSDMEHAACKLREIRGVGYTPPHPGFWALCKEYANA